MSTRTNKAMGGIAGAVALAAGSHAYGISLITAPANLASTVGTTTTRAWDANGDAINDFNFNFRFPNSTGTAGVVWQANMNPVAPGAVVGYLGPFINYATNLSLGQNVGPVPAAGASFRTAAQVTLGSIYRSGGIPSDYGGFRPNTPNPGGSTLGASSGYAGFRIGTGATARYGWLQMTVTSSGITFGQAALGDIGEAVQAGVVPEPTSLAAIALGAVAFMGRRRTKVA